MRRSRLATLIGGVLTAAFLVPSAALAGGLAAPVTAQAAPAAAAVQHITLGCSLAVPAPRSVHQEIDCHWTAVDNSAVTAYRLWRFVDGRPSRIIATITPDKPLAYADTNVKAGHRYGYRVVAIGPAGSRPGVSNLVAIRIAGVPQTLGFKCVFVVDGDRQGVWCHWSRTTRPAAVRYVLYRSVDGAARERIYRTGLNGRRSFLDTKVTAGQTIRYAVVALARSGRVVGVGGPATITVPARHGPGGREVVATGVTDTGTLVQVDGHASADGDEQALVERARTDPAAFAELYRRYLPRVHAFAYRRTGIVEVAEDITSAAFERALRNLGSFTWRGGGFGPWLFRIASNEIADHYRRSGRAASPRTVAAAADLSTGVHPDPAAELDERDSVGAMLAAMDRLIPRYQRALELRYLAGLSPQEAAAAFGTSRATMAVVVHRATRALRKVLATEERS